MAKYVIDWSNKSEFPWAKKAEESPVIEMVDDGQTEFDQTEQEEPETVVEVEQDGE